MQIFDRVFAMAGRPGPIPMPVMRQDVAALAKPEVFDRWENVTGLRAAERGDNVIEMYDVIGEDFWSGGGITAKKVGAQLRAIGDRPVEVHINSGGGDMFEGLAIYNLLREHPQPVTVKVMGIAASAASIIAMAGDDIRVGVASFLMIHNCWVVALGNRHDMRATAEFLEPFDAAMAQLYADRTGQQLARVKQMMDAETYINGTTAVELGFADGLLPSDEIVEDAAQAAQQRDINATRKAEVALCAKMPRSTARDLINKIKGTPGAAQDDRTMHDAGAPSWLGAAARLAETLRS